MPSKTPERRVYPLTASPDQTEEEIAVTFAMTSRRPEPFDEIASQVTAQKAADFHEKWVLDYGHASVAEHAVVHLAIENISRLACDALEDNRLASYTEKSSRYQVIQEGFHHLPRELLTNPHDPRFDSRFQDTVSALFSAYAKMVEESILYLASVHPPTEKETAGAHRLRLRRIATDHCRAILPAATLTNVGITANARTLEHVISKLLSHPLREVVSLGNALAEQSRTVVPTLVKYAATNPHLEYRNHRRDAANTGRTDPKVPQDRVPPSAKLLDTDSQATAKVVAAILFSDTEASYSQAWQKARTMDPRQYHAIIEEATHLLGPHDPAPREFEAAQLTFEYTMDYGALREFRRHRIQTVLPKYLTIRNGYSIPPVVADAGLAGTFQAAIEQAEEVFLQIERDMPATAQYLVTHAHNQQVLSIMNARECWHLFKLRTSPMAHFAIRDPVDQAMRQAVETLPHLFKGLKLRDYPGWWPFETE